jgi:hypothetical protein
MSISNSARLFAPTRSGLRGQQFGVWTTMRRFDVLASRSLVVLDLLLPRSSPARSRSASTSTTQPLSSSSPPAQTSTTMISAASAEDA